jgi:hypothetical protein
LPGGDNDDVLDEEKCASIAISEYCFRHVILVTKNQVVADALANFANGHTKQLGYGESMHVALEKNDYSLCKFFINHGDFSSYDSIHIGSSSLEQAAMLPDHSYFNDLLMGVIDVAESRYLTAMVRPANIIFNDAQRVVILKQSKRLR